MMTLMRINVRRPSSAASPEGSSQSQSCSGTMFFCFLQRYNVFYGYNVFLFFYRGTMFFLFFLQRYNVFYGYNVFSVFFTEVQCFFTGTMFFGTLFCSVTISFLQVQSFLYRYNLFIGIIFFRHNFFQANFLQRYNVFYGYNVFSVFFTEVQCFFTGTMFFGTLFCSVTISFLQVQSFLYRYNLFIGIIFFRHNFFQANCFKGTIFLRVPFFCIVTSFTGIFFLLPCHLMITPVHHVDCDYHFDHHHIHDQ